LIGIIGALAVITTINGLYALTGSYVYAIPFGLVAQSILLIVSLNLGRDIARMASGATAEARPARARLLRGLFLVAVYLLFFGICWFFAFSTYYNIFLVRGDDVETVASQVAQFGDTVLPDLRTDIKTKIDDAQKKLTQAGETYRQGVTNISLAAEKARVDIAAKINGKAKDAFEERDQLRKGWATRRDSDQKEQNTLKEEINKKEDALKAFRDELASLPKRSEDLQRAFQEEQTGQPPPNSPGAAPISQRGEAPADATAKARPGKAGDPPPSPSTRTPTAQPRFLRRDGFASTLVTSSACLVERPPGPGACATALETALKAVPERERSLRNIIPQREQELGDLREKETTLQKSIDDLKKRLADNPALPRPAGDKTVLDLNPLRTASEHFSKAPSEASFQALVDACELIEGALPEPKPAGFKCRSDAVRQHLQEYQGLVQANNKFMATCDVAPVTIQTNAAVESMREDFSRNKALRENNEARRARLGQAFDTTREKVIDPCLGLAAVLIDTQTQNGKARNFEREVSPRQTEFSLAGNAAKQVVTMRATPPGYLGAIFAAAQELGILLLSILRDINRGARVVPVRDAEEDAGPGVDWAVRPTADPPNISGAKIILRSADYHGDGSATLIAKFADDEQPDIQANALQLVRELIRRRLARAKWMGSRIRLSPAAIVFVERRIKDHYAARRAKEPMTDVPPLPDSGPPAAPTGTAGSPSDNPPTEALGEGVLPPQKAETVATAPDYEASPHRSRKTNEPKRRRVGTVAAGPDDEDPRRLN
jgi:hypothetical protein